ncbi:MAG: hypothetical protein HOG49_15955 [Candidatus Scalindua sp.]|jgi:hypothetical protein|nr:hypothetical protein [Candidatus Scalindua sp.]
MEKKNKEGSIKNIFRQLDDDCSLWLLGLCLASNDIVLFLKRRDNSTDEEKIYFFPISLSLLR